MAIMKTPIGNSPFLGEMFAPLLHGCYFAMARPDGHQDIAYLGSLIATHGVTHIAMTSAVLRAFLEWPDASQCRSLRAVQCGGDVVSDELRARFLAFFPDARFVVTYGTTESGHALSGECPASARLDGTRIGRPIQRSFVQLLDRQLNLLPAGEVGEMYMGGPRLAGGYLNRPAATAERFVPHPFSIKAGDRLYRAGDLGRVRADGELEFRGRVDQQVKIRGNRVELLEVEAALVGWPDMLEAAVLARASDRGETQLIAYVVPRQAPGPTVREMRDRLAKRLPSFMVPQFFVTLDEIPRTPNGKVDRKALLALELNIREQSGTEYVAPRTPTERILAEIWQRVLGVDRVGLQDNFFALGGHSILAARACAEIHARLRHKIPLSVFFGATNLALLADAIVQEQSLQPAVVIVPLQTQGQRAPLFIMPTMSGSPWISSSLMECWDRKRPVYALGLAGDNAPWGEWATLPEIASYCVVALREAKIAGPLHIMGHCFGAILAHEVARQLHAAGIKVARVAIVDTWLEHVPGKSRLSVLWNVPFFFVNMPHWAFQFLFERSLSRQVSAIRNRLRSWTHLTLRVFSRRPTVKRVDWATDKRNMPDPLRKRIDTFFHALQTYVPGPYAGHVVLLRAKTRPLFHGLIPDLNWGRLVTGRVEVITIPGDHGTILDKPNSEVLASRLQAALDVEAE